MIKIKVILEDGSSKKVKFDPSSSKIEDVKKQIKSKAFNQKDCLCLGDGTIIEDGVPLSKYSIDEKTILHARKVGPNGTLIYADVDNEPDKGVKMSKLRQFLNHFIKRRPAPETLVNAKILPEGSVPKGNEPLPYPKMEVIERTCKWIAENAMEVEGIFRIPGKTNEVNIIAASLLKNEITFDAQNPDDINAYDVCGALKVYLREMTKPLIPYALFKEYMKTYKVEAFMASLSEPERTPLIHLMRFLFDVSKYSATNKMDPKNLAVVFSPSLIRSTEVTNDTFLECNAQINLLTSLISDIDTLAPNPNAAPAPTEQQGAAQEGGDEVPGANEGGAADFDYENYYENTQETCELSQEEEQFCLMELPMIPQPCPWYNETMSEGQIDGELSKSEPGTYIIVKSFKKSGCYEAFYKTSHGEIMSFIIIRTGQDGEKLRKIDDPFSCFNSIQMLVDHYVDSGYWTNPLKTPEGIQQQHQQQHQQEHQQQVDVHPSHAQSQPPVMQRPSPPEFAPKRQTPAIPIKQRGKNSPNAFLGRRSVAPSVHSPSVGSPQNPPQLSTPPQLKRATSFIGRRPGPQQTPPQMKRQGPQFQQQSPQSPPQMKRQVPPPPQQQQQQQQRMARLSHSQNDLPRMQVEQTSSHPPAHPPPNLPKSPRERTTMIGSPRQQQQQELLSSSFDGSRVSQHKPLPTPGDYTQFDVQMSLEAQPSTSSVAPTRAPPPLPPQRQNSQNNLSQSQHKPLPTPGDYTQLDVQMSLEAQPSTSSAAPTRAPPPLPPQSYPQSMPQQVEVAQNTQYRPLPTPGDYTHEDVQISLEPHISISSPAPARAPPPPPPQSRPQPAPQQVEVAQNPQYRPLPTPGEHTQANAQMPPAPQSSGSIPTPIRAPPPPPSKPQQPQQPQMDTLQIPQLPAQPQEMDLQIPQLPVQPQEMDLQIPQLPSQPQEMDLQIPQLPSQPQEMDLQIPQLPSQPQEMDLQIPQLPAQPQEMDLQIPQLPAQPQEMDLQIPQLPSQPQEMDLQIPQLPSQPQEMDLQIPQLPSQPQAMDIQLNFQTSTFQVPQQQQQQQQPFHGMPQSKFASRAPAKDLSTPSMQQPHTVPTPTPAPAPAPSPSSMPVMFMTPPSSMAPAAPAPMKEPSPAPAAVPSPTPAAPAPAPMKEASPTPEVYISPMAPMAPAKMPSPTPEDSMSPVPPATMKEPSSTPEVSISPMAPMAPMKEPSPTPAVVPSPTPAAPVQKTPMAPAAPMNSAPMKMPSPTPATSVPSAAPMNSAPMKMPSPTPATSMPSAAPMNSAPMKMPSPSPAAPVQKTPMAPAAPMNSAPMKMPSSPAASMPSAAPMNSAPVKMPSPTPAVPVQKTPMAPAAPMNSAPMKMPSPAPAAPMNSAPVKMASPSPAAVPPPGPAGSGQKAPMTSITLVKKAPPAPVGQGNGVGRSGGSNPPALTKSGGDGSAAPGSGGSGSGKEEHATPAATAKAICESFDVNSTQSMNDLKNLDIDTLIDYITLVVDDLK